MNAIVTVLIYKTIKICYNKIKKGFSVEYKVVYSKRKSISIGVEKAEVTVRAPIGTDDDTIKKLIEKHAQWIHKNLENHRKKKELIDSLTPEKIRKLKKEARIYCNEKAMHFSNIMGLKYGRITITSAQKRFGSCSSQGNISFSYRLMLYPEAAREYVIVHELAHLKLMNHSKEFYDIIAEVLPDYKARRRLLKTFL